MKFRFIPVVVFLTTCAASLALGGCASKNSSGGGTSAPSGFYGTSNSYTPLPMNQAARTDAMRQHYRNEFR